MILCSWSCFVERTFFGQQQVFTPLLSDLKDTEEFGIVLEIRETVRGTVIVIVGYNLGSHSIGGFTEIFCKSTHFCRYCLKTETCLKQMYRVRSNKNKTVTKTVCQCRKDKKFVMVSSLTVFNHLKLFHVCDLGLPPCLAYNLFEGVISADLALYIKQLFTIGKHFSYVQLNRNVTSFKYSGSDLNNNLCEVKPGSKLT